MDFKEKPNNYLFDHLTAIPSTDFGAYSCEPICVTENRHTGLIYAGAQINKSIRVYIISESGNIVKQFTHKGLKSPLGIAIRNDNLYMTLLHAPFLVHFKLTDDLHLIRSKEDIGYGLENKFSLFDQFRKLAVSTNGDVFVTEFERNRVQILDEDLNFKRQISHSSIIDPCDVKLTADEVFVLGFNPARSRYCILVIHKIRYKVRSIILRGLNKHVFKFYLEDPWKNPSHYPTFCLDSNGNFIISEVDSNIVKFFTKEGTLFQKFGKSGMDPGMFEPITGLTLTINQKLVVVSMYGLFKMQIFSCV